MSDTMRWVLGVPMIILMFVFLAGMWWIPTMMSTYPLFMLIGNIVFTVIVLAVSWYFVRVMTSGD